ncbi:hypothetical protein EJ04DRAFT_47763 [Polyplosphaeria fusca]|uniref:Uncharacterized protein n=1 Tax=Polyplosphaeria fusca TaxID=682080 RepID=A0A9P4UYW5_9PLEO|nr:hypothetical protein EJ04DRAFT_47763 [Polyplosphaeria fusca]
MVTARLWSDWLKRPALVITNVQSSHFTAPATFTSKLAPGQQVLALERLLLPFFARPFCKFPQRQPQTAPPFRFAEQALNSTAPFRSIQSRFRLRRLPTSGHCLCIADLAATLTAVVRWCFHSSLPRQIQRETTHNLNTATIMHAPLPLIPVPPSLFEIYGRGIVVAIFILLSFLLADSLKDRDPNDRGGAKHTKDNVGVSQADIANVVRKVLSKMVQPLLDAAKKRAISIKKKRIGVRMPRQLGTNPTVAREIGDLKIMVELISQELMYLTRLNLVPAPIDASTQVSPRKGEPGPRGRNNLHGTSNSEPSSSDSESDIIRKVLLRSKNKSKAKSSSSDSELKANSSSSDSELKANSSSFDSEFEAKREALWRGVHALGKVMFPDGYDSELDAKYHAELNAKPASPLFPVEKSESESSPSETESAKEREILKRVEKKFEDGDDSTSSSSDPELEHEVRLSLGLTGNDHFTAGERLRLGNFFNLPFGPRVLDPASPPSTDSDADDEKDDESDEGDEKNDEGDEKDDQKDEGDNKDDEKDEGGKDDDKDDDTDDSLYRDPSPPPPKPKTTEQTRAKSPKTSMAGLSFDFGPPMKR